MTDVAICDYGAGNTRSVVAAFERLGVPVVLTSSPELVSEATFAVLPGVGSAKSAMQMLHDRGLDVALKRRIETGRPVLGICLGLQLAMEWSEEDGGVECLGVLPGHVARLSNGPVPRFGWAGVEPWGEAFYFAHSYVAVTEAAIATSEGVVAAAQMGAFLGVQFHPEKSGPAGETFLRKCLIRA